MSDCGTPNGNSPRISLRIRLTLWVVAIFTLIQWTTGGVLWLYQQDAIHRVFDERLLERADDIVRRISGLLPGLDRAMLDDIAADQARYIRFESFGIDVLRGDGTSAVPGGPTVFDPGDIPVDELLATGQPRFLRIDPGRLSEAEMPSDGPARVVAVSMLGADFDSYVLVVGTSDAFAQTQLMLVARIFLLSSLLGPLAAGISGWFIAGIAVAPFERLRTMASGLRPETLDRDLDVPIYNTEIAELCDQLEDTRQRLRDAFGMQERFLTNVSHELKTPIAVILAEADTIARSEGLPGDASRFIDSTREEMRHLGKLIESLLALARLHEGHSQARMEPVTLNDLVMDTVEGCGLLARQEGVRVVTELGTGDAGLEAAVRGEPQLLRTMLDNLIRNAIRFTPRDGAVRVMVATEDGGGVIRVRDQGPGIPDSEIGSVFERFKQAANQREGPREGGHGLGLSIAQGIAELHGGRIRAENLSEGGCEFWVFLPLYSPDNPGEDRPASGENARNETGFIGG